MRLTPSQLREAVTNASWRPPPPGVNRGGGPSTESALRGAIRQYHDHNAGGADAAREALANSLQDSFWANKGASMRSSAELSLENYLRLAAADDRPASPGAKLTYTEGGNEISIEIHVMVFDPAGYEVRLCISGPLAQPLTDGQRILYAAPAILAAAEEFELQQDLFESQVIGAQVWELRSGHGGSVSRDAAMQARPALASMFARLSVP